MNTRLGFLNREIRQIREKGFWEICSRVSRVSRFKKFLRPADKTPAHPAAWSRSGRPTRTLTPSNSKWLKGKRAKTKAPSPNGTRYHRCGSSGCCSCDPRTARSWRRRPKSRRAKHGRYMGKMPVRVDQCLPHTASHTNPNTTQIHSLPCRKGHTHLEQSTPPDSCKDTQTSRYQRLRCSRMGLNHSCSRQNWRGIRSSWPGFQR